MPDHLLRAAHVAGNGEVLWLRDGARAAAEWLAAQGLAITGGEVYRRHSGAWSSYVRHWTTTPARGPSEDWRAYVERGLARALAEVGSEEWDALPDVPSEPLYFFATATEDGQVSPDPHPRPTSPA